MNPNEIMTLGQMIIVIIVMGISVYCILAALRTRNAGIIRLTYGSPTYSLAFIERYDTLMMKLMVNGNKKIFSHYLTNDVKIDMHAVAVKDKGGFAETVTTYRHLGFDVTIVLKWDGDDLVCFIQDPILHIGFIIHDPDKFATVLAEHTHGL